MLTMKTLNCYCPSTPHMTHTEEVLVEGNSCRDWDPIPPIGLACAASI